MENKTEMKNISPKTPCQFCGKLGALSNAKNHQKTKACVQARNGSGTPKNTNSPEVLSIYKNNNDKRKEKLITALGKEGLREKQRLAKQAYRLKQKQSKSIDSKEVSSLCKEVQEKINI